MITKETPNNKSSYLELYAKVNEVLNSKYVAAAGQTENLADCGLPSDEETGKVYISSIEEYFSVIQILSEIVKYVIKNQTGYDADLYSDKLFIIPFDENSFEINADTRKIGIPQAFSRNGVGVEGDHFVETLYFTIDRYFDTIDFARPDVLAIIEWTNGNNEKCYSPAWTKVLDDDATKVIIGWVITDKATAKAGTIKFSVRLYTLDDNKTKITSSFATLITSVVINPSMNFDLLSADKDKAEAETLKTSDMVHDEVIKRIKGSPAVGKTANDVPWPSYVARYAKLDSSGKISDVGSYNIDDANAGDEYYVLAKSNSGTITYEWQGGVSNADAYIYVPITLWDEEVPYYVTKLLADGTTGYESATVTDANTLKTGDYYAVMGKAQIPAASNNGVLQDVTGEYNCFAKNQKFGWSRPANYPTMKIGEAANSNYGIGVITVNGPESFNASLASNEPQEAGATLAVSDENKGDRATASYSWEFKTFDDSAAYGAVEDATEATVTASNEGYWKAVVQHIKNGAVKSVESEEVIVYEPIEKPIANTNNITVASFAINKQEDVVWAYTVSGNYNKYSYQWFDSAGNAQSNSKGDCEIDASNQIMMTLSKKDMPQSETATTTYYYPQITAWKDIGDRKDIGRVQWNMNEEGKKYLSVTVGLVGG